MPGECCICSLSSQTTADHRLVDARTKLQHHCTLLAVPANDKYIFALQTGLSCWTRYRLSKKLTWCPQRGACHAGRARYSCNGPGCCSRGGTQQRMRCCMAHSGRSHGVAKVATLNLYCVLAPQQGGLTLLQAGGIPSLLHDPVLPRHCGCAWCAHWRRKSAEAGQPTCHAGPQNLTLVTPNGLFALQGCSLLQLAHLCGVS